MFEITAKYVKKELNKISFFIQYSGLFDQFAPATQNALENLPVEWESAQTDGQTQLKWKDKPQWKYADLVGKLGDKTFKMRINKNSSRNIYTIIYEGNQYKVTSLGKLKSLVDSLEEGKTPRPEKMQTSYNIIKKQQANIKDQSVKYYLNQVSEKPWQFTMQKDPSRIYLKFYIVTEDDQEKKDIKEKLGYHDDYRINSIGSYVKKVLKKEGIDVSDIEITQRMIDMPRKVGFNLTIK